MKNSIPPKHKAYDEGVEAGERGEPKEANPHTGALHDRWLWGWDTGNSAYQAKQRNSEPEAPAVKP